MTLKNNAARIALAAMLTASPVALMAQQADTGSPAQSVASDPDENVGGETAAAGSMEQTSKSLEDTGAYSDDARADAETEGSLIKTDPEDTEGSQLLTE
ncbi:hypothetical protein [Sulfitobacter alexandrii]|nr:hypothetical protein [Sulfitobacter alexandrii]